MMKDLLNLVLMYSRKLFGYEQDISPEPKVCVETVSFKYRKGDIIQSKHNPYSSLPRPYYLVLDIRPARRFKVAPNMEIGFEWHTYKEPEMVYELLEMGTNTKLLWQVENVDATFDRIVEAEG